MELKDSLEACLDFLKTRFPGLAWWREAFWANLEPLETPPEPDVALV